MPKTPKLYPRPILPAMPPPSPPDPISLHAFKISISLSSASRPPSTDHHPAPCAKTHAAALSALILLLGSSPDTSPGTHNRELLVLRQLILLLLTPARTHRIIPSKLNPDLPTCLNRRLQHAPVK